jgi:hypothetical protein
LIQEVKARDDMSSSDDEVKHEVALDDIEAQHDSELNNSSLEPSNVTSPTISPSNSGIMSIFGWLNRTSSTYSNVENVQSNENGEKFKPVSRIESHESKAYNSEDLQKENAGKSIATASEAIETMYIPQLLQSIFRLIQNEKSFDVVAWVAGNIENCLSPVNHRLSNLRFIAIDSISHPIAIKNMEAITSQKDWLQWICDCLLTFRRRSNMGTLVEGDVNELSGLESDDSYDGPYERPHSSRHMHIHLQEGALNTFCDPIFNILKVIFSFDIISKPGSQRKMYDILRLPVPEASNVQIMIIFDLLELFQHTPISSTNNNEQGINLFRNISAFLEQVLEKVEIPLEIYVKAVAVMHSLTYHAPPELRIKIKDTLLPEMRNTYVTQCLVDRSSDLFRRISALSEIHLSIQNLMTSTEGRNIQDQQVVILLIDIFLETCDEIYDINCIECSNDDDSISLPLSNNNSKANQSQIYYDLQVSSLLLIQNCVNASLESKKLLSRILLDVPDTVKGKSMIVLDALCNSFGNELLRTSSPNEEVNSKLPAQTSTSWWGSWGADSGSATGKVSKTDDIEAHSEQFDASNSPVHFPSELAASSASLNVSFVEWLCDISQR